VTVTVGRAVHPMALTPRTLNFSHIVSGPIMATTTSKQALSSCINDPDLQAFERFAVAEAVHMGKSRVSLVSPRRLIATLWLSRAALSLPAGGDFVETGVYNGGTAILLIKSLLQFDTCNRQFWGYDSFEGLPDIVTADRKGGGAVGKKGLFRTTEELFYQNLKTFSADVKPSILHVTKGYFNDTLPQTAVQSIAFLRLDGDVFSSTWDALVHLYPKVVPGGYIYVDDYASFNGCKSAVDMYRREHGITEPLVSVLEDESVPHTRHWKAHEASWWQKRW